MAQRIVVYASPVAIHKSTHKQKQRALRLMKVGYQHFYNLIFVSGCDNYLCTAMENIYAIIVKPRYNVAYGIIRGQAASATLDRCRDVHLYNTGSPAYGHLSFQLLWLRNHGQEGSQG